MMGKFGSPQIGVFAPDGNNYDNPNLNKCPNCGALFDGTICPICKTVCTDRRKQSAPPQASKPVPAKAKKPVVLIVFLVLSILCNCALAFFAYAELIVYKEKTTEIEALQKKLTNTENNAEAIRQQLAEARRDYNELKQNSEEYLKLDEAQKAAALAQAEADKAAAEAEKIKAEAELRRQKEEQEQLEAERRAAEEELLLAEEAKGYETGITYEEIARYPDKYKGSKVKFTGKVLQILEVSSSENQMRFSTGDYSSDVVYCVFDPNIFSGRVLEDDKLVIYGTVYGLHSYTSIWSTTITLPLIKVDRIDLVNE